MTGTRKTQTLPWWLGGGGRKGKDDRKQNTLAMLLYQAYQCAAEITLQTSYNSKRFSKLMKTISHTQKLLI